MTRLLTLLFAALLPLARLTADDFSIVSKALDAVTEHHFRTAPQQAPFSIARVSGPRHDVYSPVAPALERTIIASLGASKRFYVPLNDLRFPTDDERDPKDPSGKLYRGIESAKTGERVYVFYISHIQYLDAQTLHVHFATHNGPLASGGGYYIIRITKGRFQIKKGDAGWVA